MTATSLRAPRAHLSPQKSKTVQILNPAPDGSRYTSRKNADRLVKRGLAVYSRGDGALTYLASEWMQILHAKAARDRMDDQFVEQRGGVLWWNGCDHRPQACHRPGENVSLPRPDRAAPYIQAMERMREK